MIVHASQLSPQAAAGRWTSREGRLALERPETGKPKRGRVLGSKGAENRSQGRPKIGLSFGFQEPKIGRRADGRRRKRGRSKLTQYCEELSGTHQLPSKEDSAGFVLRRDTITPDRATVGARKGKFFFRPPRGLVGVSLDSSAVGGVCHPDSSKGCVCFAV